MATLSEMSLKIIFINRMIQDDRKISTSSQTNYLETEKILYPRTLHKTNKQVRDRKRGNSIKLDLNFTKFKMNEKGVQGLTTVEKASKSPLSIPFLPDIKEKVVDFFGNYSPKKQRFTSINLKSNDKKEKVVKNLKKKKNLSAEFDDELFMESPKRVYNRKIRDYSMHKTFYDIFLELSEKIKSRESEKCGIFNNLTNFN